MENFKACCIFFFTVLEVMLLKAQGSVDSLSKTALFDCEITQSKQKLHKKYIASTPELHLRANNQPYIYAILQLGKRENSVFMYIRILDKNVCIKKDQIVDIQYTNGVTISYKNDYRVNCDGIFIKKFDTKEIKKLSANEIRAIKIYTYQKNYEFLLSNMQNYNLNNQLNCLSAYKIKEP